MRHPDLLPVARALKQLRVVRLQIENGEAEFPFVAGANRAVQFPGQQLLAVTDSEDRDSGDQNFGLNGGARLVVDAAGSARDDNPVRTQQLFERCIAGENIGRNSEFPDFPRNQMAILPTGVQYCDLRSRGYFFILSTTILRALEMRASAFGRAVTAASTSGSVRVSYIWASSTLNAVLYISDCRRF